MTTAHRPTWNPQKGGTEQGGTVVIVPSRSYSARDLPGYLVLKTRQDGQESNKDIEKRDFKKDLLEREYHYNQKKQGLQILKSSLNYSDDEESPQKKIKPQQEENLNMLDKKIPQVQNNPFPEDEDDADFANSSSDDEEKDKKVQESEDSEDEDKILIKEFQKLKEQKEQEQKLKDLAKENVYEKNRADNILKGNPLLEESGNYSLNKRWYEETVFKNQAKVESKSKRKFINDNVRNEFHYKFLAKYVQT